VLRNGIQQYGGQGCEQYGNIKKKRIDDEYGTNDPNARVAYTIFGKGVTISSFCSLKYKEVLNGHRRVRLI
jgi:hypothetical protein